MNDLELLTSRLRQWQRWTKLQKMVYWGGRGLSFGVIVSVIAAIFFIRSGSYLQSDYLILLTISGLSGFLIAIGIVWFRPQSKLKLARSYDQTFDLKERVSTAIELSQNVEADQHWQELQLADALEATKTIIPKNYLKWHAPKLEISLLVIASILVIGSWLYGQGAFQQAEIKTQNQQLIEAEVENLEELISDIESSEQLSAETKEAILSPLKESLDELKQVDSLEDAVSILSDTQQVLEEINAPINNEFEGLQAAGQELVKDQDSPLNMIGEALAQGNFQEALDKLSTLDFGNLNPQELESLANQLSEMAQQLANSSPELANQLQQAADALQSDDMQSAQDALAEASEILTDIIQQAEFSEIARETADELADSQERLMTAAMFGATSQSGGMQTSSSESPDSEQEGSFGSQAGSGEFEEAKSPGKEVGLTPLTQNNTSSNGFEQQYESVYAPQRLGGTSETDLTLGSNDAEGDTIGNFSSSVEQNAQSFIPYSEVFASYEGSVQQALESGVIPVSLQPLIRDYFSSLDPR